MTVESTPWYWKLRGGLPPEARRAVRRGVDGLTAFALGSVRSVADPGRVCLTLDDGPDDTVTPALLEVLAEHRARCTFFLLSDRVVALPELTREIVAAGHEVALHGRDHRPVSVMSAGEARAYLAAGRAAVEDVVQRAVTLYRPAYGAQSVASYLGARRAGLRVVVWSADVADWEDRPAEDVVADARAATGPGTILLFHERLEPHPVRGAPVTTFDRPQVVADLLSDVRERGLQPTTVGDAGRLNRTTWFRPS